MIHHLQRFGTWMCLSLLLQLNHLSMAQELAMVGQSDHSDSSVSQRNETSLKDVLMDLETRYNVRFNYLNKLVEDKFVQTEKLDVQAKDIQQALANLLSPLGLKSVKLEDGSFLIVQQKSESKSIQKVARKEISYNTGEAAAQQMETVSALSRNALQFFQVLDQTITGKVADENDEGLPGVNILVKGTTIGTVTDVDGNYRLTVSDAAAVLVFSSVGYETEEVIVGTQNTINLKMTPDVQSLSEIVVVGYGTQERAKVTGAISTISSEEINALPVPSLDAALQGRAAGVTVTNTGAPGANPIVRIRGIGTVGNNDPLYVIDGMPAGGLNSINPNDIESISILKDASTAAIYGSRGANGVIMVTTKKGTEGRTRVNIDSYYGIQNAWKQWDLLNVDQYLAYGRDLQTNGKQTVPQRFDNLGDFADVETDWQDELFQTASIQDHNISISGGSENARFNVGGGYFKQEGIMLGTGFERISIRANTDFKVGKRVNIGQTLTLAHTDRNVEPLSGGRTQIEHMIKSVPYIPVRDASRTGGFRAPDRVDGSDPENPILNATLRTNDNIDFKILGTAYAEVDIIDGLKYKFLVGLDMNYGRDFDFTPIFDAGDFSRNPKATISDRRSSFISPLIRNQLAYTKTFGNHTVDATAVIEQQTSTSTFTQSSGENSLTSDILVTKGVESPSVNGGKSEYALISYIGRVNYDYDGKYLLGASIRRDGGSRFGPDEKWGTFSSVSAGWRISEEGFMENISDMVSDLKLRGSWGQTGNDRIGDYKYQATIDGNFNYNFNGELRPAGTINALANENIKWETTIMTNLGFDLGLFENQFTFSFEWFLKETQDMLLELPIPPSMGYDGAPVANVGNVENKGIEMMAGYRKSTGNFQWSVNGNISFVKNKLTSLGVGNTIFGPAFEGDAVTFTEENQPIAYFYGWVVDGIFQEGDDMSAQPKAAPGDIRFKDIAGAPDENGNPTAPDGVIDANDRTNIGHFLPDFTYGLNATANWKGFDFTLFLQGVSGNEILNTNLYDLEGMTRLFNAGTAVLDRWTPENTNTDIPRAVTGDPNRNSRISTRYIEDGSYLRIKNLAIGYTIPTSVLSSFAGGFISNVRFYLSSQNLLTITKYSGYDPEIGARNGNNGNNFERLATGVDYGQFPQPRTFIGGIQIGF